MKKLTFFLTILSTVCLVHCGGPKGPNDDSTVDDAPITVGQTTERKAPNPELLAAAKKYGFVPCQEGDQQTATLYPQSSVPFGEKCEGQSFTRSCKQEFIPEGLVWVYQDWAQVAADRSMPQYQYTDCTVIPPSNCGKYRHNEKFVKKYFTQAKSSPGNPCPDVQTSDAPPLLPPAARFLGQTSGPRERWGWRWSWWNSKDMDRQPVLVSGS